MTTISYTRKGSGEPLVLCHGIGHRRTAWADTFDLLSESFEVIALDLPGFGESPAPRKPHSYRLSSYVDQLEEFFTDLDLDRPHFAGNSLGGLFALELAARGSVRTATAISPAGFWNARGLLNAVGQLTVMKASTYAPPPVLKLFADKAILRKLSMRALYVHPERLSPEVALGDTYNLRRSPGFYPVAFYSTRAKCTGTPVVPTTVAWGTKDRLLLPSQAQVARERLPHVRHVTLPACGHVPMLDNPQLVAGTIAQTIAEAGFNTSEQLIAGSHIVAV